MEPRANTSGFLGAEMKKLIVLLVILLAGCATLPGDKWTTQDKTLEATYLTLHAIDWRQTRYISEHPGRYYECNPVLGRHPSTGEVDLWFASTTIAHVAVTHLLPQEYRKYWQWINIGMSGGCVGQNINIGIGVRW